MAKVGRIGPRGVSSNSAERAAPVGVEGNGVKPARMAKLRESGGLDLRGASTGEAVFRLTGDKATIEWGKDGFA